MRKITFLLTLLLMYVGVMPMMAQTNLNVKQDVQYTIKNTYDGVDRYVYAGENRTTSFDEGNVDLTDDKYKFTFKETGNTTSDGFKIYYICPVAYPGDFMRNYHLASGGTGNVSHRDRTSSATWCVIEDDGIHKIQYVNGTSRTSDYWVVKSKDAIYCSSVTGYYEDYLPMSFLKIEEVGSGEGGGEGGGESGGNEGGSGETTTNNLPEGVKVSATPTAQKEWVEGSHFFYTIKNAGTGNYLTTDNMNGQDFTFDGSVQNPDKSGYWCIAGNDQDGYSFYNYETGEILATRNKAFLRGESRAFLKGINEDNQSQDEMKFVFTTSNPNTASSRIKVVNTDYIYWIAHTDFRNQLKLVNDENAISNPAAEFIFEEVFPFAPINAELTTDLIKNANAALSKTGLGYPTADCDERATLSATITASGGNPTNADLYDELVAAYKAFLKSPNVTMPEDGKAYVFTNKRPTVKLYLYDNNGTLGYADRGDRVAEELPMSAKFICRKLSDNSGTSATYAFVNNNGQFLVWKGDKGGADGNDGFAPSYSQVTIKKTIVEAKELEVFGTMDIAESGKYLASTISKNFSTETVQSSCYDGIDGISSAFIIEEVPYPNIVTLTEVTETDVLCGKFKGKTIATFSAPFATVIPEGVTAYWATNSDGYVKLQSFSDGKHLPANFGVILVGENNGITSALMKPRTTEELVQIGNGANHFENSAGATTTTVAGDYVLADGGQGIGFYEANAGGTLAMNKAFLRMGASNVAAFRLVVDEEVTAIDGVATEKVNAPIYDLSGRRVLNTVKGGIYIQNGKKFIVK